MPRSRLYRIRQKISQREYDITAHAVEEMAEDQFTITDVETSILGGQIVRTERDDPRSTKYVIEGTATEAHASVVTVGRYTGTGRYLIITVYQLEE